MRYIITIDTADQIGEELETMLEETARCMNWNISYTVTEEETTA